MGFKRFIRSYFFQECTKLLTVGWGVGFTLLLSAIWLSAFRSGGKIIININAIGEMYFELILGLIFIPFMLYGYWLSLKEFESKKRRLRKSVIWFLSLEKVETL